MRKWKYYSNNVCPYKLLQVPYLLRIVSGIRLGINLFSSLFVYFNNRILILEHQILSAKETHIICENQAII